MAQTQIDAIDFAKQDKDGMYGHIQNFNKGFLEWWAKADKFPLPAHYIKAKKIVLSGMGGSAQGGSIVKDLLAATLKVPIEIVRDYHLPNWVDADTLVIAVSYSGTTEETLGTFIEGYEKGAKLLGLGTGGQMAVLCRKYKVPYFEHDYQSQPRAALHVHLAVILNLLTRLGHGEITAEMLQSLDEVEKLAETKWAAGIPEGSNEAKQLAVKLAGKVPIIVADGTLSSVSHRWKAHFNENSKCPAYSEILPEMNHNALVGTEGPREAKESLHIILLDSQFTDDKNKTRTMMTEQLYKDRRFVATRFAFPSDNPLQEAVAAIRLGDHVSYYLALLYGVDPTQTDIIKEFKSKLDR